MEKAKGTPARRPALLAAGALAALYLVNPTAGIFELLPDNLPLVGNLDEAGAVLLLSNVLAAYGVDLQRIGRRPLLLLTGLLAALYLANPTAGLIELLPDNLPLMGNLDEAGATLLLLNALAAYGVDMTGIGRRLRGEKRKTQPGD